MHEHIIRIKDVAHLLTGLEQPYVFVGGATVALYATHPETADEVRPTEDVDVVVELISYSGYAALSEKLLELGFKNDVASGVICRYNIHGIIVDIMPTEPKIIGFSNKWYPAGFKHAETRIIDENTAVRIFSLPYFIASKWEAFKSRGENNFRASHDFEDIVYVLEQCHDFEIHLKNAPPDVFEYLQQEVGTLLDNEDFTEGISCHMRMSYYGADADEIIQKLRSALI